MTAENPQVFTREAFIYFFGEHFDLYYFFPVSKMSKIFLLTVIEEKKNKKKVIFRNQLKKLNFDETSESNIKMNLTFMAMALWKLRSNNSQMM